MASPDFVRKVMEALAAIDARGGEPAGAPSDDKLVADTSSLAARAGAEATRLGVESFAAPAGFGEAVSRRGWEPAVQAEAPAQAQAQAPAQSGAASSPLGTAVDLANRWAAGGAGLLRDAVTAPIRAAADIAANYRPGAENEPLNADIGRQATTAAAALTPQFARAAGGAASGELAVGGGSGPKITALVAAQRGHPEFEQLATKLYEQMKAQRAKSVTPATRTAAELAGTGTPEQLAVSKLSRQTDAERLGEIAENIAAWQLYKKQLGTTDFELGAAGGVGKMKGQAPNFGLDDLVQWAESVGLTARVRYAGQGEGTIYITISDPRNPAATPLTVRIPTDTHVGNPKPEEFRTRSLFDAGTTRNEAGRRPQRGIAQDREGNSYADFDTLRVGISDRLGKPRPEPRPAPEGGAHAQAPAQGELVPSIRQAIRDNPDITPAQLRQRFPGYASGDSQLQQIIRTTKRTMAGNEAETIQTMLNQPAMEQRILEMRRRGESPGMIANMLKREQGWETSDPRLTADHVRQKLGELRARTRGASEAE